MQPSPHRNQGTHELAKKRNCASLSVVVVASGSPAGTARAAQTLKTASNDIEAQLIVVSQSESSSFASSIERIGAEFVAAPRGSSRAEMCDLAMRRTRGPIVVVRDVDTIGDAQWLDTYRRILPKRAPVAAESVVLESMVAVRSGLADARPGYATDRGTISSSVEAAAAL